MEFGDSKCTYALGTTENSIKSIEKNRFSSSGLTGEHCETRTEIQFKTVDQSDVLKPQTGEHGQPVCFHRP